MKFLLFLFVPLLTIVLFFACNSNDEENTKTSENGLFYPEIGQVHNQVLDSILKDLWKAKIGIDMANWQTQTRSTRQASFTLQEALNITLESIISNQRDIQSDFPNLDIRRSVLKETMYNTIVPTTRSENDFMQSLTPFQQKYYSQIINLFHEKGITVAQFQKGLLELQQIIKENAPVDSSEADVLYYGISVAYYSSQYWEQKASQWGKLASQFVAIEGVGEVTTRVNQPYFDKKTCYEGQCLPCPDDPHSYYILIDIGKEYLVGLKYQCPDGLFWNQELCQCDWEFSWSSVGEGDVYGAVGGAAGGAVVGAWVGGVGAAPGAAAGAIDGAIAGSAASAIGQIWDYFF